MDEKSNRGGRRPGAGRPRKQYPRLGVTDEDPVATLKALMLNDDVPPSVRLAAAKALHEIVRQREFEKNSIWGGGV